eukprot:jgi/Mesvir1/17851/Mv12935-RA.1
MDCEERPRKFPRTESPDKDQEAPRISSRHPDWKLPPIHEGLRLSSHEPLRSLSERRKCPGCSRSRQYFCYDCVKAFTDIPTVTLPVEIHILMHKETRPKSTAIQAALLAPGQVFIHEEDADPAEFLSSWDPDTTMLLFPSKDATPVSTLDVGRCQKILVLDSKWKKATNLASGPALANMARVSLNPGVQPAFWRPNVKGCTSKEGVSTVEAIYFLCKQLHEASNTCSRGHVNGGGECPRGDEGAADGDASQEPEQPKERHEPASTSSVRDELEKGEGGCHCYDNLLYYFSFFHSLIEKAYLSK